LPALDHPIDICKHSFSQFCRLEYVGTGAKAKNNETGVIFIFELGTHRDPSVGVVIIIIYMQPIDCYSQRCRSR
jgi:hypothetical protein